MATAGGRGRSSSREGTAKAAVADQISQSIQSTSNLLHLMQQSSPSQAHLAKLPKNLLGKSDMIKNTGQVLQQLPVVISSLDAYMENGLHSIPHLKTVTQLLDNMENSQLKSSQLCLSEQVIFLFAKIQYKFENFLVIDVIKAKPSLQSRLGPADQSSGEP